MAQSLSKIYIHLIFHVKTTSPVIGEDDLSRVHSYIGQLVNVTGCRVVQVGGIKDHVHILFLLSKNESLSHIVEEVKRNSSRWIKTISEKYVKFEWQGGYGAFSVSQSVVDRTLEYIRHQKKHHLKLSFKDEYKEFLTLYGVKYDEQYLFCD
ncbi:MAG: transposase [Prevotella sp.]